RDVLRTLHGTSRGPECWFLADAWEHLGRPDSAAVYLEDVLATDRGGERYLWPCGVMIPFAHSRLVVLYSQLGRLDAAERHWRAFSRTLTRPDRDLLPLIADTRATLGAARAMAVRESRPGLP